MPKNVDLPSLQAEVLKEEERKNLPEAKKRKFSIVKDQAEIPETNQENMNKATEYAEMVREYSAQLNEVKKLFMKGNREVAVRSLEAPLITLVYSAEKLQAIYKNEEISERDKQRIPGLENIIRMSLQKIKTFDKTMADIRTAEGQKNLRRDISEALEDIKTAEPTTPVIVKAPIGESFKEQNKDLLDKMKRLDSMIEAQTSGVGGFFRKMFSSNIRELKKQRMELMQEMEERTPSATRPSASRAHTAMREASARLNRNITTAGQVGRFSEPTGDGFTGSKVELKPEKNKEKAIDMKEFEEVKKRKEELMKKLSTFSTDPVYGARISKIIGEKPVAPVEEQKLSADDEALATFKRQQKGFGGFFRKIFGYSANEKMDLEDQKNIYEDKAMGAVDPNKRTYLAKKAAKEMKNKLRDGGKGTMVN